MNSPAPRPRLRVEIAPEAWATIGRLPSESFRRLRQQLELLTEESVAELTGRSLDLDRAETCPVAVSFDRITARCSFNPTERLLTLLRVEPAFLAGED